MLGGWCFWCFWHGRTHGGKIPPRLRLAPLTVLSPGPRLAGRPSRGKEMTHVRDLGIGPISQPTSSQQRSGDLPGSKVFHSSDDPAAQPAADDENRANHPR